MKLPNLLFNSLIISKNTCNKLGGLLISTHIVSVMQSLAQCEKCQKSKFRIFLEVKNNPHLHLPTPRLELLMEDFGTSSWAYQEYPHTKPELELLMKDVGTSVLSLEE